MTDVLYGTDEGFRRAIADANRMRMRTLGMLTTCAALVVAVSGGIAGSHRAVGGTDRLDVVDHGPRPAPATASVSPAPAVTTAPPVLAAGPAPATRLLPHPTATTSAAPVPTPPAPSDAPRPTVVLPPQSTDMTRTAYNSFNPTCGFAATADAWCFTASPPRESPKHVWALRSQLCPTSVTTTSLAFGGAAEVEVRVTTTGGRVLWSWVAEHGAGGRAHTLDTTQRCFRWDLSWFARANDGAAVPNGGYVLEFRSLATSASIAPVRMAFTLR